jgi:hypothetical protein
MKKERQFQVKFSQCWSSAGSWNME